MKTIGTIRSLLFLSGVWVIISCNKTEPITRAVNAPPITQTGNQPVAQTGTSQVVYAGYDFQVEIPASECRLSGAVRGSNNYSIKEFSWAKISGPSTVSFDNPNSLYTIVRGLEKGVYQFELTGSSNTIDYKDTVMVTVGQLPQNPKEIIFNNLTWFFPWYNTIAISNFYNSIAPGTFFKAYIQRDNNPDWVEVKSDLIDTGNNPYDYFIEGRPDGGGMYTYGSLNIFYYGTDVSDTPDIKIVY